MSLAAEYFTKDHFSAPANYEEQKELFRNSVSNVVVEISSFCNRHCTYCPISQVDRSSSNRLLPDEIFNKLVDDLERIDYAESVCLNLYNEPMSDRELLLSRISLLRQRLPKCRIYFSTNGDYLSREYLKAAVDAGLSELYVTLHAPKGKPYDDAYVIGRISELSARLGKAIKVTSVAMNQNIYGTISLFGIKIHVFSTNYAIYGSDRAGAMTDITARTPARKAPCDRPFHDFTISYEGTLFPCCQMFVDNPMHKKKYSVGNLASYSNIYEAYASQAMAGWRKSMLRFGPKESPCDTCSEADGEGTREEITARDQVYRSLIGEIPEGEKEVAYPVGTDDHHATINRFRKLLKGLTG
ncbi:radical SAM protein [Rhizobium sp. BR 249]|uniref:radical SAM/SPASM domain-containing protein n=1 Tax=Rhizobium sp. BR 249 TaxID=3040011 RepID=UPI0039BF551A